jgi:hypothetical protein
MPLLESLGFGGESQKTTYACFGHQSVGMESVTKTSGLLQGHQPNEAFSVNGVRNLIGWDATSLLPYTRLNGLDRWTNLF